MSWRQSGVRQQQQRSHFKPLPSVFWSKDATRRNDVKRRQTTLDDRQKKTFLWSRASWSFFIAIYGNMIEQVASTTSNLLLKIQK